MKHSWLRVLLSVIVLSSLLGCDALHPRPVAIAIIPAGKAIADVGQKLPVLASIQIGNSVDHDVDAYHRLHWKLQGPGTIGSDDSNSPRSESAFAEGSIIHYIAAGPPGSFALISATSDLDPSKVAYLAIQINPAITLATPTLPDATLGKPYLTHVDVNGGSGTKQLRIDALPEGLTFDGNTGVLSGVPTRAATHQVTVQVHDESTLGGWWVFGSLRILP